LSGVHALVLAAGSGRRFGGGKLLAPFRGGVLLDAALAGALAAPVEGVILVSGADREAVEAAASCCAARLGQAERLRIVHAADHAEGLAASIRAGVAALPQGASGVLIFLGDMPDIPAQIPVEVVARLGLGAEAATPTHQGRRGHPAGFASSLFPALAALEGDRGARELLVSLGPRLAEVPAEAGVLADVDTPEDLEALDGA
jgi:molybdenum cofactor cytidylyltransferase